MHARRYPRSMRIVTLSTGTALVALLSAPVLAQSEDDPSVSAQDTGTFEVGAQPEAAAAADANTRRTFTPADFARFAPRSALDMVEQIPGFSIRGANRGGGGGGGDERGLGQADTNVLINGQRISGKSNGPVAALQRIPSDEVVRLEIVDGASLDIGGLSGQVLNVITRSSGGVTGQFRYSAEWRSFGVPFRWGDGQISLAGGGDNSEWTLSFENDAGRRGDQGFERVFDADGNLIDLRDEQSRFDSDRPELSGSFSRVAANGNVLNLNGQIGANIFRQSETSLREGPIDPRNRFRLFRSKEDEFNFELGTDYAFEFGPGRLKLIGYYRYEDRPTQSVVVTEFSDGSPATGSRFTRDADESEAIVRAEYSFGGLGGDLQLAAEGVKNTLEIQSELESLAPSGDFVPVAFNGATARVDEDRAEASVTYSRQLAPGLQFQTSLGAEYSKISQSGAQGQTRTFYRPKGFVSLDWKANDSLNISTRIAREVGQLDFFDFIASTDLNEGQVDVTNANLVPPQSWVFEIEAVQSLGALGSLNLRGFHQEISDIVDQIPIAGGGQAPGNIDSATISGVEAELTLLFDPIGVRGLRLDASAELTDSEVLDPLLGNPRAISGEDKFDINIDIRQDFIGTPWAIGASWRYDEREPSVRLDEISRRREPPGFGRVFVEHKDVFGMTARFRVGNILDRNNFTDRTVFIDRAAGLVDFTEDRDRRFGTVYSFDIEGSF